MCFSEKKIHGFFFHRCCARRRCRPPAASCSCSASEQVGAGGMNDRFRRYLARSSSHHHQNERRRTPATHLAAIGCDGQPSGDLRRRHLVDLEPDGVQHRVKLRRLLPTLLLLRRPMMIHGGLDGRPAGPTARARETLVSR